MTVSSSRPRSVRASASSSRWKMTRAPEACLYCDGKGNGPGAPCGFCVDGKPLDTQEDWDRTWGRVFDQPRMDPNMGKMELDHCDNCCGHDNICGCDCEKCT